MKLSQGHCQRGKVVNPETNHCLTIGSRKYRELTENSKPLPPVAHAPHGMTPTQPIYTYIPESNNELARLKKEKANRAAHENRKKKNAAVSELFGNYAPQRLPTVQDLKNHAIGFGKGGAVGGALYGYFGRAAAKEGASTLSRALGASTAALGGGLSGAALSVAVPAVTHLAPIAFRYGAEKAGVKIMSHRKWTEQVQAARNKYVDLQNQIKKMENQKVQNDKEKDDLRHKLEKTEVELGRVKNNMKASGFNYHKYTDTVKRLTNQLTATQATYGTATHAANANAQIRQLRERVAELEALVQTRNEIQEKLQSLEQLDTVREALFEHVTQQNIQDMAVWEGQGEFLKSQVSNLGVQHATKSKLIEAFNKAITIRKRYEELVKRVNAYKNLIDLTTTHLPAREFNSRYVSLRSRLPDEHGLVNKVRNRWRYINNLQQTLAHQEEVRRGYTDQLAEADREKENLKKLIADRNALIQQYEASSASQSQAPRSYSFRSRM
jgi:predicted  nucleic acid-binding Zn-ribbon protein